MNKTRHTWATFRFLQINFKTRNFNRWEKLINYYVEIRNISLGNFSGSKYVHLSWKNWKVASYLLPQLSNFNKSCLISPIFKYKRFKFVKLLCWMQSSKPCLDKINVLLVMHLLIFFINCQGYKFLKFES